MAVLEKTSTCWSKFVHDVADKRITKAAILKPFLGPREKGVIFISFENQWAKLLEGCDLKRFSDRYTLVVSPTWCPPHSLVNFAFPAVYPGPVFTLISNLKDLQILPRLSPNYVVVPLFASSWVNPGHFEPRPRCQRDLDIVMVANFGQYKRHHALFGALRKMPGTVRATLIGQAQDGRTADTIRAEAANHGVLDRVTVHSSVTNEFLSETLCRAKISLIMSRREGSCVAVAESLFADTPVGLLENAEIGSKAFINEATGQLLRERCLGDDVLRFLNSATGYSPRAWAMQHISCTRSSATLNRCLREHSISNGQEWTRDVATLCWHPDPMIADDHQRAATWVQAEQEYLRDEFGISVGAAHPVRFEGATVADSTMRAEPNGSLHTRSTVSVGAA
jgi:glycosyltransferase involved in cell wall biosynthesis